MTREPRVDVHDGEVADGLRRVEFEERHRPLREDVGWLGALVGDVLREQGGDALFDAVEKARRTAIREREASVPSGSRDDGELRGLAPEQAEDLVRAFSTYFQVVNLAEKTHRIRRRLSYERQSMPQPHGFADRLLGLRESGLGAAELQDVLDGLRFEPVFTAHPTEATRRSLLEKEQTIARLLVERMGEVSPRQRRAAEEQIRIEVTAGWQTVEHTRQRPTVAEERDQVLFYLARVLFRITPRFYEGLEEGLALAYPEQGRSMRVPSFLRFSSWVGGDMDGNPNVRSETVERSLEGHRSVALRLLDEELRRLASHLTQAEGRVGFDESIARRTAELAAVHPEVLAAVRPRHREMPYRVLLELMAARLSGTAGDEEHGYASPEELDADLESIESSLRAHRGLHAGVFAVRRARRRLQTFGFHLAGLDCRQDAVVHRRAAAEILGRDDWQEMSAADRSAVLRDALRDPDLAAPESLGEEAAECIAVLSTVARCRRRFGERAVGPFIISMAEDVDDVLTVLLLARLGGCVDATGAVTIDVAPLFETVADLQRGPRVLRALRDDPVYGEHLANRARGEAPSQMVMIGYSDSSKDGGIGASRWALHRSQREMAEVAAAAGMRLVLFHGRGGTIGRGGGNTDQALLGSPRGSVMGTLRVTEQGEVIDEKYGLRPIALRTLDRSAAALLTASLRDAGALDIPTGDDPEGAAELMELVSGRSREAYRGLVYEHPSFFAYFREATPIDVIERLKVGSRPASRRSQRGIEDLRAIPWVFAWTQSRHVLPGWFGLGTGLGAAADAFGLERLRRLLLDWPFLGNLVSDAEMALGKADIDIARSYSRLARDPSPFAIVEEEYRRTVHWVLELRQESELLSGSPTLRRAIRLRNPYIDPMSDLQIDLLERWRRADRDDPALERALIATVNGIARGLQNTG